MSYTCHCEPAGRSNLNADRLLRRFAPRNDKDYQKLNEQRTSYYEMDAIVTWNFEHMIKWQTKKGVVSVNVLKGFHPIEIISPLEVT